MATILIFFNSTVLIIISLLHIYWAMGGAYGSVVSLPAKPDGQLLFKPGPLSTLAVAVGLLIFAFVTIANLPDVELWLDKKISHIGTWIIAVIFIGRAVGDFRFVGFFKRITDTAFARNDSRIYSPLSLAIGVISCVIAILV